MNRRIASELVLIAACPDTIQPTRRVFRVFQRAEELNLPEEVAALLGPLASPAARHVLQRLAYLYNAALTQIPGFSELWNFYLHKGMLNVRAGGGKKISNMKDVF